jgi:alkylhydroperoxidase/carboxymuconolactone decarboxylase family protein YurZ
MPETLSAKEKFYEWANETLIRAPFDARTSHLMGLVAALTSGYEGAVGYFYHSAKKAGASEAELAGAADIAASAAALNIYALMPREE